MMPIKVVIVDDSALIRSGLKHILDSTPDIRVVGSAPDPLAARQLIRATHPDVITLDIEMSKMDGLEFLEKLMRVQPTPVIMISSLTERSSDVTLRALELGAVDFVTKPKLDAVASMEEYSSVIVEKIRSAAKVKLKKISYLGASQRLSADVVLPALSNHITSTEKVIIIGASTGGTEAIKEVLTRLPADSPGILITQHMPEAFTRSFAQRLNKICKITVKEAESGDRVLPGHAYIAPGHSHLLLKRSGANYMCELNDGPAVNRHRPSVDVLFRSAANFAGQNAIGVILSGMGKDGAAGMLEMKNAGAYNFAQDEASCVVYGMPREAVALGGVDAIVSLNEIAARVLAHLATMGQRAIRV